jgi:hypothetical protein
VIHSGFSRRAGLGDGTERSVEIADSGRLPIASGMRRARISAVLGSTICESTARR